MSCTTIGCVPTSMRPPDVVQSPVDIGPHSTHHHHHAKNTPRIMNGVTFALLVVLIAITPDNASGVFVLNEPPPMLPVSSAMTDQCQRRLYTYRIVQSDAAGRQCWDLVNVWACFGRCVSQEIADWKFPHRLSYHPVCVHDGRDKVVAYLRQCDDGVAAALRRYEYVEAVACKCQKCSSKDTRCEAPQLGSTVAEAFRVFNMVDKHLNGLDDDDAMPANM